MGPARGFPDFHGARLGIDNPGELAAGGEELLPLALHCAARVRRRENLRGDFRSALDFLVGIDGSEHDGNIRGAFCRRSEDEEDVRAKCFANRMSFSNSL